jgi:hypothetical protein
MGQVYSLWISPGLFHLLKLAANPRPALTRSIYLRPMGAHGKRCRCPIYFRKQKGTDSKTATGPKPAKYPE